MLQKELSKNKNKQIDNDEKIGHVSKDIPNTSEKPAPTPKLIASKKSPKINKRRIDLESQKDSSKTANGTGQNESPNSSNPTNDYCKTGM